MKNTNKELLIKQIIAYLEITKHGYEGKRQTLHEMIFGGDVEWCV